MEDPIGPEALREAARLRYELSRLRDRRTVRAALAIGEFRRAGAGPAFAALRGRAPRMDVPGPTTVPLRPPFPHLRVLCTGEGQLVASTAAHERVDPATGVPLLRRDRPDLVLVDGLAGWTAAELAELRAHAREAGIPVVTLGQEPADALPDAELRVAGPAPVRGAHLDIGATVDIRSWSPAGLQTSVPAHQRSDPSDMTPAEARRQPVVVVPDVGSVGVRRILELLSAGALVLTGPDSELADALAPHHDEVVGPVDTLAERAAAMLADDDRRDRTSVRLRRQIHARRATRGALIAVVEALDLDVRPSERISVLLPTTRPERVGQTLDDLAAQRHPDVEVLVLAHGDAPLPDRLGVAQVIRVAETRPLGAVLNVGLDQATGHVVAKVDDDDRYGPDHLGDQLLALHHSGAELTGKRIHGVYDEAADETIVPARGAEPGEECYEDHLPGGTLLLPADVLRSVRWRHVPRGVDTELVRAVHLGGGSVYSTHRYGYVRVRHGDHLYEPEVAWAGVRVRGFDLRLLDA